MLTYMSCNGIIKCLLYCLCLLFMWCSCDAFYLNASCMFVYARVCVSDIVSSKVYRNEYNMFEVFRVYVIYLEPINDKLIAALSSIISHHMWGDITQSVGRLHRGEVAVGRHHTGASSLAPGAKCCLPSGPCNLIVVKC